MLIFILSAANSYSQKYSEYEVKAGYLYNFSKFINWPEQNNSKKNFVIGIYNGPSFTDLLSKILKNRKIQGRKIIVKDYNNVYNIENCDMLFIINTNSRELKNLLKYLKGKPILTVGDNIEEFCEKGGLINFTGKYAKHRFQINNEAAKKSKITISSKLLKLAKIITEDETVF